MTAVVAILKVFGGNTRNSRKRETNSQTKDYKGTSEAAPCPLQPCYFDKWDFFADIWDRQYTMGFPVCIFMYLGVSLHNFLPIFPIS